MPRLSVKTAVCVACSILFPRSASTLPYPYGELYDTAVGSLGPCVVISCILYSALFVLWYKKQGRLGVTTLSTWWENKKSHFNSFFFGCFCLKKKGSHELELIIKHFFLKEKKQTLWIFKNNIENKPSYRKKIVKLEIGYCVK